MAYIWVGCRCTFFQWADFDDDGDPRNLKEMVSREAAEEER